MSNTNSFDFLLKEIEDEYVRENFYRLKLYLERVGFLGSSPTINQNINISGIVNWEKVSRVIPASSTIVADTQALVSFKSIHYIMNLLAPSTSREKNLKMDVNKDDSLLEDQVYAISGAPLSVEINANINGSNFELEMINNEAYSIEVNFARLILP